MNITLDLHRELHAILEEARDIRPVKLTSSSFPGYILQSRVCPVSGVTWVIVDTETTDYARGYAS